MERGLSSESNSVSGPPTPSISANNQYTSKPSGMKILIHMGFRQVIDHVVEMNMPLLGMILIWVQS
jgi:hypothetical protein